MAEDDVPAAATAAAAVARGDNDDATARPRLCWEQLTGWYGFDPDVAAHAIAEVIRLREEVEEEPTAASQQEANTGASTASNTTLLEACCNYILEHDLGQDRGGPITPIDHCPHIVLGHPHCGISMDQLPRQPGHTVCTYTTSNASDDSDGRCTGTENWLCLECGVIRCSRYVHGHGLQHWQETATATTGTATRSPEEDEEEVSHKNTVSATTTTKINNNINTRTKGTDGHCLAVSLSDLSVWCHQCQAYVLVTSGQPHLQRFVQTLEARKFNSAAAAASDESEDGAAFLKSDEPAKKKHKSDSEMDDEDEDSSVEGGGQGILNDDPIIAHQPHQSSSETELSEGGEDVHPDATEESDDSNDDDDENPEEASEELMAILARAAAAQGIPLEWLIRRAVQGDDGPDDNDDSDDEIDYPFETPPKSLQDVANFIQSDQCQSIVVLAGAGMSVASGIPDFRSADGLYATLNPDLLTASESERAAIRLDPTVALDQHLFLQNPLPMLELQREFILGTRAQRWKATLAHRFVELLHARTGKLVRHYTQNIDGLEDQCTALPRTKVLAVHGSMDRAECARCQSESNFDEFCNAVQEQIKDLSGQDSLAPRESSAIECPVCGYGALKPSIVLFRSSLPKHFFENVPQDIGCADLLLIIGTSLRVAPANSLVWRAPKSAMRVLVNREEAGDHLGLRFSDDGEEHVVKRDYFAQGEIENVLLDLMEHLGWIDELEPLLQEDKLPESSAKLLRERLNAGGTTSSSAASTRSVASSSSDDEQKPAGEARPKATPV